MSERPSAAARFTVILLLGALVTGYLLALFLTRDIWADREGTRLTLSAQMRDGSRPTPDVMPKAVNDVAARLADRGVSDADVVADGNNVAATFDRGDLDADTVREMFEPGQIKALYIRPVIHAIPARPQPDAPPLKPTDADPAKRIADEKQLRQSTEQGIQLLGLQFQAERCEEDDPLAGRDDPSLPLITCSTNGEAVYLLDKSTIGGEQVRNASARWDSERGQHVVELEFDESAARTWADYTAAHVGTQTAFTLGTRVVSAPQITQAIPNGRTYISGGFDADTARVLADTIRRGASPVSLTLVSSADEMIPPSTLSKVFRVAVVAAGIGLAVLVIGAAVYFRRHS